MPISLTQADGARKAGHTGHLPTCPLALGLEPAMVRCVPHSTSLLSIRSLWHSPWRDKCGYGFSSPICDAYITAITILALCVFCVVPVSSVHSWYVWPDLVTAVMPRCHIPFPDIYTTCHHNIVRQTSALVASPCMLLISTRLRVDEKY